MTENGNIWFTSDHHFGHTAIISACDRPWRTVNEMEDGLVERWNSKVDRKDRVYVLGDFSFYKPSETQRIVNRLNGQIHLVRGNHDSKPGPLRKIFASVSELTSIKVPDPRAPRGRRYIVLCHYPLATWNQRAYGSWMLHGHSHGGLSHGTDTVSNRADVGVDCWDMYPVSYDQIRAWFLLSNRETT
jgi:calcineurin-like phosphoesterase family protein